MRVSTWTFKVCETLLWIAVIASFAPAWPFAKPTLQATMRFDGRHMFPRTVADADGLRGRLQVSAGKDTITRAFVLHEI